MREKRRFRLRPRFEVAEHAADDALTPAEIRVLRLIAKGMPIKKLPSSCP